VHNPYDQLAKQIGKGALDPSGRTVVQREIARDAQHADLFHEPDPTKTEERARLGLLGRLVETVCLLEIFSHPLAAPELRACLAKHFAHWEERARKTRATNSKRREKQLPPEPLVDPFLWILAAEVSAPMLRKLKLEPAPSFPAGVYLFGDDLLRVGLVVVSELPRDRDTLLVRIMAAGPRLGQALEDLAALPKEAHEHALADQILLNLRHALGAKPSPTPEDQELLMTMYTTFAELKDAARNEGRTEGRAEGRTEGRTEGHTEAAARHLLTVLRVRSIAVPEAVRERIQAEKDLQRLERWLEKAAVAATIAEVIDEAS
jgi:post-segregation antitoxin (ccd killing protein)